MLVAAIACAAPSYAAGPSAADLESARALYKEGRELKAAGKIKEAIEKLKAAHALGRTPVTGIELARTQLDAGHLVEAREVALDVGRIPVAADETDKSAQARRDASELAERLKPRIPTLITKIVTVTKSSAELLVSIDGAPVPAAAIGEARKVNPGTHEVRAHYEGGDEVRAIVVILEGETKSVELSPPAPKVTVKPGGLVEAHKTMAPTYVAFGVAGVGVVLGTITGLVALTDTKDLENQCSPIAAQPGKLACPRALWGKLDEASMLGTISTIGFVVAGAAAAFGLGWWIFAPDPKPEKPRIEPVIGLGTAGIRATF